MNFILKKAGDLPVRQAGRNFLSVDFHSGDGIGPRNDIGSIKGITLRKHNPSTQFMIFRQSEISLKPYQRGFHLITPSVVDSLEFSDIKSGMLQVFIKHTSASLTINENADPTVRLDFESHMNVMVPEDQPYYEHIYEGSDDMPAHIKSSLMGSSVMVPILNGKLGLGTWQGIYLCEHRNYASGRRIIVSAFGI